MYSEAPSLVKYREEVTLSTEGSVGETLTPVLADFLPDAQCSMVFPT